MKKNIFLTILLFIVFSANSQISVSSSFRGSLDKFKPEVFKTFKGTTTIFILSNIFDKSKYDELLKSCWTVTPYKIVSANDFDYNDYLDSKYSFAHLRATVTSESAFYLNSLIDFYMLDMSRISLKLDKSKDNYEKFLDLVTDNKINIGSFQLYANTEMLKEINKNFGSGGGFALIAKNPDFYIYSKKEFPTKKKLSDYRISMRGRIYDNKSYKSYSVGMLKNYFQKMNSLLTKEEFYWMYESDIKEEVKNLKTKVLYIPDYNKITYRPGRFSDEPKSEKELTELFEDYKYKYEFISVENLDSKILNNEEVYYLQYVRVNNEKFFSIVNGKTGEVVYRDYEAGMGTFNIDNKDFKNLAKAIDK